MGKKKLNLSEFCIEVTRKCNMKCEHCLRGNAQSIDIDNAYITKALEDINTIGTLTFTGGEPSLNIKAIQFTLDELKRLNISVDNFYIVFNGRKTCQNKELLLLLINLYHYQSEPSEYIGAMVQISQDNFHSHYEEQQKSIQYLSALSFFETKKSDYQYRNIITEGRGKNFDGRDLAYSEEIIFEDEEYNNLINVETMVYLNAKGQICNDCDYSYQTQQKRHLFNLNDTTLIDGIINQQKITKS